MKKDRRPIKTTPAGKSTVDGLEVEEKTSSNNLGVVAWATLPMNIRSCGGKRRHDYLPGLPCPFFFRHFTTTIEKYKRLLLCKMTCILLSYGKV